MASGYDGAMRSVAMRDEVRRQAAETISAMWAASRIRRRAWRNRPRHKQENIGDTICIPGYTNTVRRPSSYISRLSRGTVALVGARPYRVNHARVYARVITRESRHSDCQELLHPLPTSYIFRLVGAGRKELLFEICQRYMFGGNSGGNSSTTDR